MSDVLVMEENLFGAGRIHYFTADRTPIVRQVHRFMVGMIGWNFSNCTAWPADGHEGEYKSKPPKRNQTTSTSRYQQNP